MATFSEIASAFLSVEGKTIYYTETQIFLEIYFLDSADIAVKYSQTLFLSLFDVIFFTFTFSKWQ